MRAHAVLAPSAAARWINCPASIEICKDLPTPPSTSYADEGTLAHAVAELKLTRATGDVKPARYTARMKELKASEYWSGEMDEATDFYRDQILEAMAGAGPDAILLVEQHFSLDSWAPGSFGTSDAVILAGDQITVIDLKYGQGIRVDAKENPQLRLYALGAAAMFGEIYELSNVRTMIIQPRLDHVSVEEITLHDLQAWGRDVVRPAADAAIAGTGSTACGDWCRWCPAKAICRKRAEENLALARMEFKKPDLLTTEEIGEVLRQAEELSKWAGDVQTYALEQALAGEHFDGWKVVEGRSVRKYADDLQVAEKLKAAGWDEALLYERKLYGITAMERIVGKKKLTEILGDLVVKPAGKPVLVPESDKREALNTTASAQADFDLPFC